MPLCLGDEVVQQNGLPDTPEPGQENPPLGGLTFSSDDQAAVSYPRSNNTLNRGVAGGAQGVDFFGSGGYRGGASGR